MENNVRKWEYYPIEMPLRDGKGPASIKDADQMTYEVWDWTFKSYGSFSNLPDAINYAIKLNGGTK